MSACDQELYRGDISYRGGPSYDIVSMYSMFLGYNTPVKLEFNVT